MLFLSFVQPCHFALSCLCISRSFRPLVIRNMPLFLYDLSFLFEPVITLTISFALVLLRNTKAPYFENLMCKYRNWLLKICEIQHLSLLWTKIEEKMYRKGNSYLTTNNLLEYVTVFSWQYELILMSNKI